MIKLAITGGIGSGKTFVSHLMELMSVPIYNTDIQAKRLMLSDPVIREKLIALLGKDVYQNKQLNKPLIGAYLFSDPAHVAQINSIVHPRVRSDFEAWARVKSEAGVPIVGIESAILYEAGFDSAVDVVALVYAPQSLRVNRAMQRDGLTAEQVLARIALQMDEEEKRRRADYTIVNDQRVPLIIQLEELIERLKITK